MCLEALQQARWLTGNRCSHLTARLSPPQSLLTVLDAGVRGTAKKSKEITVVPDSSSRNLKKKDMT